MNCPKCDRDISDTFQEAEPDVGIATSGWYCDNCDLFVEAEDDESDYFDGAGR